MRDLSTARRCVIADDVRSCRELVAVWMTECGFECTLSENGLDAWEQINVHHPDVLITDLDMPKLCGLEILKQVRGSDDLKLRELPVLVMTSLRDSKTPEVIKKLGGDALLQKPLNRNDTIKVVSDVASRRPSAPRIFQAYYESDDRGDGVISPTLRQLLRTISGSGQR